MLIYHVAEGDELCLSACLPASAIVSHSVIIFMVISSSFVFSFTTDMTSAFARSLT